MLGRAGLGHDRPGLRVEPRPLEDDPAVEPGEVLGVGQPDVDDGQAARREVVGERPRAPPRWAARVGRTRSELSAMKASPNRAGIGQAEPDEVGLDERQAVARRPCRAAAPPGPVEHRRIEVDAR